MQPEKIIYGSGHGTVAVLLPGFAINQATGQPQFHDLTHILMMNVIYIASFPSSSTVIRTIPSSAIVANLWQFVFHMWGVQTLKGTDTFSLRLRFPVGLAKQLHLGASIWFHMFDDNIIYGLILSLNCYKTTYDVTLSNIWFSAFSGYQLARFWLVKIVIYLCSIFSFVPCKYQEFSIFFGDNPKQSVHFQYEEISLFCECKTEQCMPFQ